MEPGFDTFPDFLRSALTRYFRARGSSKLVLLALLFASREAWGVALGHAVDPETGKRVLKGVGGAAAVALLLRVLLGGPLGLLLGGISVASLVAVYVKEGAKVGDEVVRVRAVVTDFRTRFAELDETCQRSDMPGDQRELMMEGLMSRFLVALDEKVESPAPRAESVNEFAAHVAARHAEESGED